MIVPMADHIRNELQLYPHIPDPKTNHDIRYDSDTYISIQTKVNNDMSYEKKYIAKLVADGWVSLKNTEDISKYDNARFPFWNIINGPISDALWHCGQVVLLRRSSGNPFNSKVSVFSGKLRD